MYARTPMRPEATEAWLEAAAAHHANPTGAHRAARHARRALDDAHAGCEEATDDAALIERKGGTVLAVTGEPSAHKITSHADLAVVAVLMGIDR